MQQTILLNFMKFSSHHAIQINYRLFSKGFDMWQHTYVFSLTNTDGRLQIKSKRQ